MTSVDRADSAAAEMGFGVRIRDGLVGVVMSGSAGERFGKTKPFGRWLAGS